MKIALIGATGFVGTALLGEALERGHRVTAVVRHPDKLPRHANLSGRAADVRDPAQVKAAVAGHDAVISAYNPGWKNPEIYDEHLRASRAILEGARRAGVRRVIVIGGAGSLEVAPGVQLVDTPQFPAEWKAGALAAREAHREILREGELEWTFVSPAALLEPGPRTGKYRIGGDQLLMSGSAPAKISVSDLAVAVLDELEKPRHIRKRFTAAY